MDARRRRGDSSGGAIPSGHPENEGLPVPASEGWPKRDGVAPPAKAYGNFRAAVDSAIDIGAFEWKGRVFTPGGGLTGREKLLIGTVSIPSVYHHRRARDRTTLFGPDGL